MIVSLLCFVIIIFSDVFQLLDHDINDVIKAKTFKDKQIFLSKVPAPKISPVTNANVHFRLINNLFLQPKFLEGFKHCGRVSSTIEAFTRRHTPLEFRVLELRTEWGSVRLKSLSSMLAGLTKTTHCLCVSGLAVSCWLVSV